MESATSNDVEIETMPGRRIILIAIATAALAGCSNSTAPAAKPYNPVIPTSWASTVTNAYLPLVRGTTFRFKGPISGGEETVLVEVLAAPRTVNGVVATDVRDRVYLNGELVEDTYDQFAQDATGNVWYLGESVKDVKNGVVVSTAGSWEWGVDGALPGIAMWANPAGRVGNEYRQEYYAGRAEDFGKVISVNQSVTVPFGAFTGCIVTEEWTPLDPTAPRENKTYCPQVGQVRSVKVGATDRVELIGRTP